MAPRQLKGLPFFLFIFIHFSGFGQSRNRINDSLVMGYFQDEQYIQAINYLLTNKATEKGNEKALSLLGYAYFMNHQYQHSTDIFQKILPNDSLNISANNYLARISFLQKNYPSAIHFYHQLVIIRPLVAYFSKQLATSYKKVSQIDSAVKYYFQADLDNPQDPDVVVSLSELLEEKRDSTEAD
ncbi:MAG: tetratricopeptide repeat protein [Chitinophagaceae bacterium]